MPKKLIDAEELVRACLKANGNRAELYAMFPGSTPKQLDAKIAGLRSRGVEIPQFKDASPRIDVEKLNRILAGAEE